jgi:transketolase
MHAEAGVGHLGGNLSCIDILLTLFGEIRRPVDHVVLSKGHSAGALYVALAATGALPEEELRTFHQDGTRLAGHPPINAIPEIPFATGSLGHGLSLAAGLALAARYTEPRDRKVFCVMSDGEWQEGSTWEGLWFAAHHRLGNLTIVVDMNGLQGFGRVDEIASMHELGTRLVAFGLCPVTVDGHDPAALREALGGNSPEAIGAQATPKVILATTIKGRGLPGLAGEMRSHYDPVTQSAATAMLDGDFGV